MQKGVARGAALLLLQLLLSITPVRSQLNATTDTAIAAQCILQQSSLLKDLSDRYVHCLTNS